jgi:hypothetical protein
MSNDERIERELTAQQSYSSRHSNGGDTGIEPSSEPDKELTVALDFSVLEDRIAPATVGPSPLGKAGTN